MPIYEYRCGDCGHEFETIQKISDEPLRTCPACHEDALVKKVSAAAFRLKGGGWYETDFKSGSKRNVAADAESASGADGGGKLESGNGSDGASKAESGSKAEPKPDAGSTKAASDGSTKKSDGS